MAFTNNGQPLTSGLFITLFRFHISLLETPFNVDISNWSVSRAEFMTGMFNGATAFNQNISSWNVSKVIDMSEMFYGQQLLIKI